MRECASTTLPRFISTVLAVLCLTGMSAAFSYGANIPVAFELKNIKSGEVRFKAIGRPSALKIVGESETAPKGQCQITENELRGEFTFDLTTLETGIKLRDRHMKEKYLGTKEFPQATLKISKLVLPKNFYNEDYKGNLPFKGVLKIRGIEKEVDGRAKIKKKGSRVKTLSKIDIKIADFGIPEPGFAGITMADDVKIEVAFEGQLSQVDPVTRTQ